jgi:3-dehydroquinate dehydratase
MKVLFLFGPNLGALGRRVRDRLQGEAHRFVG